MNSLIKKLSFFLIITCFGYSFSAEYYAGLTGGLSFSGINSQENYNKYRLGISGSGSFSMKLNSLLMLQSQFGYVAKGFGNEFKKTEFTNSGSIITTGTVTVIDQYNYLEIPILLKFVLFPKLPVQITPVIGSFVSYLVSAGYEFVEDGKVTSSGKINMDNNLSPIDFGITLGVGAEKTLGPGKITFTIRSSSGLISLWKEESGSSSGFNQTFYFLLGYEYKIKS